MNKRIEYLDVAKGIAIICIIIGHLGSSQINRVVFTFHVPLFYIITGYFINTKYSIKEFIKRKFKRLVIPYLITSMVIVLISYILSNNLYDVKRWVMASIYGAGDNHNFLGYSFQSIGAIWFLLSCFFGSIILRILLNTKKSIRIISVTVLFIVGYFSAKIVWLPLSIQAGFCAVLFMYIGYLVNTYFDRYRDIYLKHKKIIIICSCIIWIQFIYNFKSFWLVHCDIGRGIIDIIGCLCACYIVVLISRIIKIKTRVLSKILKFIGRSSLLILCIHVIELDLIPWIIIIVNLIKITTINYRVELLLYQKLIVLIAIAKLLLDIGLAYVLSKCKSIK